MEINRILVLAGIIVLVLWRKKANDASTNKDASTNDTSSNTQNTNNTTTSTPYDRYKSTYSKGVLIKSNVEVNIMEAAGITSKRLLKVHPNVTLGRTTGKYVDIDDFRWIEVELSSEVKFTASLRINLLSMGKDKFWTIQDFVGQVNVLQTGINLPFFK
ncbi:MAG: hypothetical protein R2822_22035 [Spirosomataceae bacterium]